MNTVISLAPVDLVIIAIYFLAVLLIGFYLKRFAQSGEDFFMAGREMTAWVAGLSFLSANLGSLELLGWAGSAYQYGILSAHWYWVGAIPAMLFLGIVMMPFYYISKTHSVPGYLQLRYGNGASALSATTFAVMTILMSGVNMYAMAVVMKVVLGWNIHFSIWVSSLTVGVYVAAGGLYSAIFNEVLQFFLIWFGALLVRIFGLIETGGFWGLLMGVGSSVAMFFAVKANPKVLAIIALSDQAKPLAEDMYRALWSTLAGVIVTVLVSLMTKPKPEKELVGLVMGATEIPREDDVGLLQRPIFWAAIAIGVFLVIQWIFW